MIAVTRWMKNDWLPFLPVEDDGDTQAKYFTSVPNEKQQIVTLITCCGAYCHRILWGWRGKRTDEKAPEKITKDSFINGNSEDVTSGHGLLSDCLKVRSSNQERLLGLSCLAASKLLCSLMASLPSRFHLETFGSLVVTSLIFLSVGYNFVAAALFFSYLNFSSDAMENERWLPGV